ncbi:MAG: AAA family ATPase [Arcobacteraceae bacterium]|nr:AAA family ATPase [Arcobacteraceae bacterium]
MTLDSYQININEQKELDIRKEDLVEVLKFYVLFSDITKLSFYEYNYEVNNFTYDFSVDSQNKLTEESDQINMEDSAYSIIIEDSNTVYGMITFNENPGSTDIANKLLEKIKVILRKQFKIRKELLLQESTLDIYIISDEKSKHFANLLNENLNVQLNVNIKMETSVASIADILKEKIKKSILIYTIEDISLLKLDEGILQLLNEVLIVIGPNNYDLSLFCGHLDVYKYLSKEDFTPEELKNIIIESKNKLHNKYINKNKIIALSGISGGIGTTTASMNIANLLAKRNPEENILYIDLSKTKSISNLFLDKNPLPKKTIIDLVNSNEFDLEKNLENGLVKIRENFFAINGIQKHIDGEFLEQPVFIDKLLEYISIVSSNFNFIIIDTGEADASALDSTIYDISNELWILTEMSLPHISKLKTFFSLMKRAGLKDKLSFIVSRYDSANAISVADVTSILNTANEDHLNFNFKLPNEYSILGHSWNYCELVTDTHPKSTYVQTLESILIAKKLYKKEIKKETKSISWLSFLK